MTGGLPEISRHMSETHRNHCAAARPSSRMWQTTFLVLLLASAANGQGLTKGLGVGAAIGSWWKPDIQMPIPEKVEATISMQPTTVYKATMELHTKGFCVPRQAWQLQVSGLCLRLLCSLISLAHAVAATSSQQPRSSSSYIAPQAVMVLLVLALNDMAGAGSYCMPCMVLLLQHRPCSYCCS